jgi:hypothetical protein
MTAEAAERKAREIDMTKEEFCARFKAVILLVAATLPPVPDEEGHITTLNDVADYADLTAPTYWDDPAQRAEGPEECARADISYWGE